MAWLVILTAVGQASGLAVAKPTFVGWNDISRWCTVWGLLERGTYAIDECPWQAWTQDKVYAPRAAAGGGTSAKHFYSSKPPLLPTAIACLLYPLRAASGIPLEAEVHLGGPPLPAYILYFKPIILLLNVLPFGIFLVLYARLLDRHAASDWSWFISLFVATWGTQLFAFTDALSNHTIGAFCAFFAAYSALRIWEGGTGDGYPFALAGFFGALCACNELPATLFGCLIFIELFARDPRRTLLYFVPAACVPCLAFLAIQYLAFGSLIPAYGRPEWYLYEGSYWANPQGNDLLAEPKPIYLFHMVAGHHGMFSLTPILLLSAYSLALCLRGRSDRLSALARVTGVSTAAMLAFYTWRTHNYGGISQAPRWLLWLFPLWLALLPQGLDAVRDRPRIRRLALAAVFASAFSVGYALQGSWSKPWLQQLLTFLGLCDEY